MITLATAAATAATYHDAAATLGDDTNTTNHKRMLQALVMVAGQHGTVIAESDTYGDATYPIRDWVTCTCNACGLTTYATGAAIDHIDNDGFGHVGSGSNKRATGVDLNADVVAGKIDLGSVQILCANCNNRKSQLHLRREALRKKGAAV